jgi:hypothetical protein
MSVYNSKYEQRMITIKEHQFHDRTTKYHKQKKVVYYYQNLRYQHIIYTFILINVIFHFKLFVLDLRIESLYSVCQGET